MRECYHLDGQFKGWNRAEADRKLQAMIGVVRYCNKGLIEISSTIDRHLYGDLVKDKTSAIFSDPYFFCFNGVVRLAILATARMRISRKIAFILDNQSNLEVDAHVHYKNALAVLPSHLRALLWPTLTFADDAGPSGLVALQAADLIAWHIRRLHARFPEDKGLPRPELKLLRDGINQHLSYIWKRRKLRQIVKAVNRNISRGARENC